MFKNSENLLRSVYRHNYDLFNPWFIVSIVFDRFKRTFFSKKTFFFSISFEGEHRELQLFLKRLDKVGNFYLFIIIYLFKVLIK